MNIKKYLALYIVVYSLWFIFFLIGNGLLTPMPRDNVNLLYITLALICLYIMMRVQNKAFDKKQSDKSMYGWTLTQVFVTILPSIIYMLF